MNSLLPSQEHQELSNTGVSPLHDHCTLKEMQRTHQDSSSIPNHPCRPLNRERRQHYALVARKQSDSEQNSRDARKKRLQQGRVSNRRAEHSRGRTEACSINIATNRTGDMAKHKEDQEMDKTEEDRMVDLCFARLESREDKIRT